MHPRRFACLMFLSTLPLAAQGLPGLTPPPNPAPVVPKTPEEELAALQREKERLLREIEYVQGRVANAKTLLTDKFASRGLSVRTIDAGRSSATPQVNPPMTPRHARLMAEDEATMYPPDVMMVVAGAPVSRAAYDQLLAQENPNIDPSMRGQMSLYDLIRIEGIASAFPEGDHEVVLAEIVGKLGDGKTVAELAPTVGTLPGAEPDGRIEVPRNSRFGPCLEQVAFDLEVGATSRPFKHHAGFVVLHKDSIEKGATPDLDKVVAHALQVPYTDVPEVLQKAQFAVSAAQIDIAVRDRETMMLLPAAFRSPEFLPPPAEAMDRMTMMRKSLETLHTEIENARAAGGELEQSRLPMLEERFRRLKDEIQRLESEASATPQDAKQPEGATDEKTKVDDEGMKKRQARQEAAEKARAEQARERQEAAEKEAAGEEPKR